MTSRTTTPRRTSAVRPVDLSIRVTTPWSEGKNELEYTLDSPDSVLGRHQVRIAGPSFGTSADEFQKRVFEDLEALRSKRIEGSKLSTREVLGEAVDLGQELYRSLIPDPLKEYFRQARDKARTLLVTSDEYFMPWELLHDGEEFLCLRFRMGRWQAGGGAPGTALGIRRILGLSSFASNGPRDELGILRNLKVSSEDLHAVLEEKVEFAALSERLSSTPFDLFHFVGHGLHELGDHAKKPRILTADRPFHPTNVSNEIRSKLRREKPLVVLNACEVGRLGPALTGRKGWPDTFVGSGCAGFVAPSWSVATASAFQFASTLYPALRDGETLGDAVHAAREALRAEWTADLAWLAYTFYGHPNARVNFGRNAGPRDAARPGSTPRGSSSQAHSSRAERDAAGSTPEPPARPGLRARSTTTISRHSGGSRLRRVGTLLVLAALLAAAVYVLPRLVDEPVRPNDPATRSSADASPPPPREAESQRDEPAAGSDASPPFAQTSSTVPMEPPVPGRVALLASSALDPEVARAAEQALRRIPGTSVVAAPDSAALAYPETGSGHFDVSAKTPWGARYWLFAEGSFEPILNPGSNLKSVSLTLKAILVDPSDGSELAQTYETHTGIGGTTDAALLQAADRCLRNIRNVLEERIKP